MSKSTSSRKRRQSKLEAALGLHDKGYWIAICQGKAAVHSMWQKQRLIKKDITAFLEKQPDANIAFVLNKCPFIDVECDSDEAEKILRRWFKEAGFGRLPETPTYRSARGKHRLFRRPRNLPEKAVITIEGVEFRIGTGGKGALSHIPPSIHESGMEYKWERGKSILEIKPATLPGPIAKRLREHGAAPKLQASQSNGAVIASGKRNETLTSIAGTMRRRGLNEAEMLPSLLAVNNERCRPPLVESEVRSIARSIAQMPPGDSGLFSLTSLNSQDIPQLAPPVFHGLAGDIIETIDPFTESSRGAVLAHLLVAFPVAVGRSPHFMVQHDRHPARLNALLVGQTSKGRKGMSWGSIRDLLDRSEKGWTGRHLVSGLSSGEGLINRVGDNNSGIAAFRKRILVIEPEFASTLTVINREGNTLSSVIRQAWDDGNMSVLTRNQPLSASDAHIGIIGHITQEELNRCLTETQKANGFGNRFLYFLVCRSKVLPDGAVPPDKQMDRLAKELKKALQFARKARTLKRDGEAKELWYSRYELLSEGKPGMLGVVLSRAEAQVLRLSIVYALLDRSKTIKKVHLEAGLALWDFCEASAQIIFGDSTGDPSADRIYQLLGQGPKTETEISHYFGRHISSAQMKLALDKLEALSRIKCNKRKTRGRPTTVWSRIAKKAK